MKNKGVFLVAFLIFSTLACQTRSEKPRRTYEDGIEAVDNGLEPYAIKGQANQLRLEKKLLIDFEDPELAAVGIQKIWSFDVDSQGNIYIWSRQSSENFIFKFDPSGKFDHAFGRSGEGPGEIGALAYLRISQRDEIIISDYGRNRLILMSASGNTLNELHLPSNMDTVTLLANGKVPGLDVCLQTRGRDRRTPDRLLR
ncbi:MAG: 6-bladed beta-propeller [Candidatus Aminicenantales bacterium]